LGGCEKRGRRRAGAEMKKEEGKAVESISSKARRG
jgi:hypothetical protein